MGQLAGVTRAVGTRLATLAGRSPERSALTARCPQCSSADTVEVVRLGPRGARWWCRRCGAVASAPDAAPLRQRSAPPAPPPTPTAGGPDPLLEFMPAAMVGWVRARGRSGTDHATKAALYGDYRRYDRTGGGPPGLPSFPAVVAELHQLCYSPAAAARALLDGTDADEATARAVRERVEHARRWLSTAGRDHCWVARPVPAGWDALVERQRLVPLWRSELLTAAAWSAQAPTLMAVVRGAGGRPVALFHARHLGLPADPRRYAATGRHPAVGLFECRLHPVGSIEGHVFAAGTDPDERARAVAAFEQAAVRRLGTGCAGVAYRHVTAADLPAFGRGPSLSRPVQPTMEVEVGWTDPEDYLRSLGKRWRGKLRRIRTAIEADPTLKVAWEPAAPAEELLPLVEEVRGRHAPSWRPQPPIPAHYLTELVRRPETSLLTYREDTGRLLAFLAVHDHGEETTTGFWGARARTDGGRPDLYFDYTVRVVERALERGQVRVLQGKGMNDIKARCGATPNPRYVVGRPGWPVRR